MDTMILDELLLTLIRYSDSKEDYLISVSQEIGTTPIEALMNFFNLDDERLIEIMEDINPEIIGTLRESLRIFAIECADDMWDQKEDNPLEDFEKEFQDEDEPKRIPMEQIPTEETQEPKRVSQGLKKRIPQ